MIKIDTQTLAIQANEFSSQQLENIIASHYRISLYINLALTYSIIMNAISQDYINTSLVILFGCFNFGQYCFFKRHPSFKCLYLINFYNILIALYRLSESIKMQKGLISRKYNSSYLEGLEYMVVHLSLLVNPFLSTNLIIMMAIFLVNVMCASIIEQRFYYESLILLPFMIMYTEKLRNDIQCKKKLFQYQQKNQSWEKIFKHTYIKDEMKINLTQSNDLAATELLIFDSASMRKTLRDMTVIGSNKQSFKINLEKYIFNLTKQKEISEDFTGLEQIIFKQDSNAQIQYETQIYSLDHNQQIYILTFKNIKKELNQRWLKDTILNQQMSLCTIIHQQYELSKKILQEQRRPALLKILIKKNQANLLNYLEVFRTHKKLIPKMINMDKLIQRLRFLFPSRQLLYFMNLTDCFNDKQILSLVYQNLCSFFFDDHQCKSISLVSRFEHTDFKYKGNLITVSLTAVARSRSQKKLIQKDMNENHKLDNFRQIKRKGLFKYLVAKKLLSQIGPNDHILVHKDGGNSNKQFIFVDCSIEFSFYQNIQVIDLKNEDY